MSASQPFPILMFGMAIAAITAGQIEPSARSPLSPTDDFGDPR